MISADFSLPEEIKIDDLLDTLRHLSWGAADILMAYARGQNPPYGFSNELDVQDKEDGPVSAADLAVNSWLLDGLQSNFPSASWTLLSEENAKGKPTEISPDKNEFVWVLDPLDGTKDFLSGSGEYAVHLALVKEHSPVIGVVLVPECEELWFGVIGHGAWCENRNGHRSKANFSNRSEISKMTLLASKTHRDKRLTRLMEKLSFREIKGVGSVGCKVATILRGDADVYISLSGTTAPKDWDMAAPEAVLRAAGGNFTHEDGTPLTYNKDDFEQRGCLIASNGNKHDLLCQLTLEAMESIESSLED